LSQIEFTGEEKSQDSSKGDRHEEEMKELEVKMTSIEGDLRSQKLKNEGLETE